MPVMTARLMIDSIGFAIDVHLPFRLSRIQNDPQEVFDVAGAREALDDVADRENVLAGADFEIGDEIELIIAGFAGADRVKAEDVAAGAAGERIVSPLAVESVGVGVADQSVVVIGAVETLDMSRSLAVAAPSLRNGKITRDAASAANYRRVARNARNRTQAT